MCISVALAVSKTEGRVNVAGVLVKRLDSRVGEGEIVQGGRVK